MVWSNEMVEAYFERNPEARDEECRVHGSVLQRVKALSEPVMQYDDFDTEGDPDEDLDC